MPIKHNSRRLSLKKQKAVRSLNARVSLRNVDNISRFSALLALIVAVVAAYFTAQQVIVAKESMRRQLRAYITISLDGVPTITNGKATIDVKIKNVGATPADHVRLIFPALPKEFNKPFSKEDFKDTDKTVYAGAVYTLGNSEDYKAHIESGITENDLISNRVDGSLGVILMKVDYVDVFHQWHERDYCEYFTPLDFDNSFRALPCNVEDAYDD